MTELNFSLWDFSLRIYAQPGVAAECLVLQDNYSVDVNILLWCQWLENQQKRLDQDRLHQALGLVTPWAVTAIDPLRQIRRQLKNQYGTTDSLIENLRRTIKQAELQAEQQAQWLLYSLAKNWPEETTPLSTGENLYTYLTHMTVPASVSECMMKHLTSEASA